MADDEPSVQLSDRATEKWAERRHTLLNVLLGAVLALGASLATTYLQLDGAKEMQQAQFTEENAREDRTRRAEVYLAFLDAANAYAVATRTSRDCTIEARDAAPPGSTSFSLDSGCVATYEELASSRYTFQGARNQVFYYGSQEAEDQAGLIAGYLPPAVGGAPRTGLPDLNDNFLNYDQKVFSLMYSDFNEIVRCEVPASPRPGC